MKLSRVFQAGLAACAGAAVLAHPGSRAQAAQSSTPIQHVIIIMQENRSFDQYFGTFPGADGIPKGVCLPLDLSKPSAGCVAPFHDTHDSQIGGPHAEADAQADIDDGITSTKLDGFVSVQLAAHTAKCLKQPKSYACADSATINRHDVIGYHNATELPNYWAYAQHFVLQDRLFEGVRSWSGPSHLDMASEWWATCANAQDVSTCVSGGVYKPTRVANYPWVSLFQLLDVNNVSWKYYISNGSQPDCDDSELTCDPVPQNTTVPSIWNPAPGFAWVKAKGTDYIAAHNPGVDQLLVDLKNGTLPQVAWIVPTLDNSEHPGDSGVSAGQMYVTSMVNAIMGSPYWNSTAIFISWDDWGGFYDHVVPPNVDRNSTPYPIQGFGIRVPGLMLSAYARAGMIDHQTLSFENYAILFENLFMNGARLDPTALGTQDSRPTIRDEITSVSFPNGTTEPVGDLLKEFDFTQKPIAPLILTTHIPTSIRKFCRKSIHDFGNTCEIATVTVTWNPIVGTDLAGPFTYHVVRDGVDLPKCVVQATSCTDKPGPGAHLYQVYSVDAHNVASPASPTAEADEPSTSN